MTSDGIGVRDAIARLLQIQGISQRELGRRLGWSHTKVQRHMASDERISVADLEKIAEALDVPVTTFLPGEAVAP
jgi:transcriptional regulator with XRE-family HTH domain